MEETVNERVQRKAVMNTEAPGLSSGEEGSL